jgi:hypothetical protein
LEFFVPEPNEGTLREDESSFGDSYFVLPLVRAPLSSNLARLLIFHRDESKRSEHRDIQFKEQLDNMTAILGRLDGRVSNMSQETNEIHSGSRLVLEPAQSINEVVTGTLHDRESANGIRVYEELVESLWNHRRTPGPSNTLEPEWIRGSVTTTMHDSFRNAIVQSLIFETIEGRKEAIPQAFEETFSWIFSQEPTELDGRKLWASFPAWLKGDTGQPYWITGKPGSGKSTLMKFIQQQHPLIAHLKEWAEDFDLLITSYYAWVAGSNLQKSYEGLMRTLLCQILRANPSLAPEVAPRRWLLALTLRSVENMPPWHGWEIEESFGYLLSKCGESTRLALFIDGLDEFDSPPFKVLDLIQNINSRNGIKVCVASRQWTEFNDAFHQSPMLRMQDLTAADMAHFVEAKLEGNRGFLELKKIYPIEATHLLSGVVTKAEGVFLWVSIVVRSLLEALSEGDVLSDLQAIVDQLPSDIAQLYDAIWARIGSRNIVASAKLLVTFKAAKGSLSYLMLWLADEKQALDFNIGTLSAEGRSGVREIMGRRLDSRTRGILEVSTNGTINFLHRTARDWALQPGIWEGICSQVPGGFDPYLHLLRAETLYMPDRSSYRGPEELKNLRSHVNRTLWYASQVKKTPNGTTELVQILNKFDKETDGVLRAYLKSGTIRPYFHGRNGGQEHLHWSSFQASDSLQSPENTFLGLMARFCVLPYLRTNMLTDPNWTPSNMCLSLLENAIFGVKDEEIMHIERSQRIETVAFLLENGVSRKQVLLDGKLAIEEVRAWKKQVTDSESDDYWIRVEELLNSKRSLKESLKTTFGRVKGR